MSATNLIEVLGYKKRYPTCGIVVASPGEGTSEFGYLPGGLVDSDNVT